MAAARSDSRMLPGPPRRRLVGPRSYAWTFDRHPLRYLDERLEGYGPVSSLAGADSRLVFALGSAANEELRADPERFVAAGAAAADMTAPGVTVRRLRATAVAEHAVLQRAHGWIAGLAEPKEAARYTAIATAITASIAERWGYGQQLDLVYIARRLNLGILSDAVLDADTMSNPEQQKLVNDWIFDSAGSHLPGRTLQRSRRMAERVAALATEPLNDPVGSAQLLSVLEPALTSALIWTVLLLAEHPRVLRDVRAELRHAASGTRPTLAEGATDAAQLPLLRRVIKESLRLLPPYCVGIRQVTAPAELLHYQLAPGTTVLYSPFHTHRTAALFFAPRRFRPERWLYIAPTADEYLPLGLPGQSALTEPFVVWHLTLILAALLQRAQLVLAAGARVDYQLHPVLLPKGELPMIVAPLERQLIQRELHGTLRELVDFGGA